MSRAQLAIIATPALGNLVPAVEFAEHLINLSSHMISSVTILATSIPQRPLFDDYIQSISDTTMLRVINIHPLDPPPPFHHNSSIEYISQHIENHKPVVKQTLQNLMTSANPDDSVQVPLVGVFIDMFCTSMIDIANDLNIPSYLFFASPAAYLGFVLHLTTITESVDSLSELAVPSYSNSVPSTAFPSFCRNKKHDFGYSTFVSQALKYKETKGIVINTFKELEPYAIESLSSKYIGLPSVYPVGPLIDHVGPAKWHPNRSSFDKIVKWLDRQPSSSVVFLCFGSMGSLNQVQVREIAIGLERTRYRFLWAIREPPKAKLELPNDFENMDQENFFPNGFIERTTEIGLVCGWVPQVSVLAHRAIGGFVSHCGWNSILESIWYGVPMSTWPLYAEQQLNAFEIVKELELGVEMRLDMGSDLVVADEVERFVRELMDGGGGGGDSELRKKVTEMSEISKKALMENGSSFMAFKDLINCLVSTI